MALAATSGVRAGFTAAEYGAKAFPPPLPHRLESLRGPGESSWALRGFLLLGPHLGTTQQDVVAGLRPLLQAGVSCFVCMQQELPSVVTQQAAQARSTYGAANVVTARPYMRDAQAIVDAGGAAMPQAGGPPLSFVHAPIAPTGPGVLDDGAARRLCLDLLAYMRAGEMLYLHCGDGNGRSGTIAALLMGLALGLGPVEAMALCQKARNDRGSSQGPCPETHEQRMQVHRLLSDEAFRQQARDVVPRRPDSEASEVSALLARVLGKVRALLAKKGGASLIYLRRYASKLALAACGGGAFSGSASVAERSLTANSGAGLVMDRAVFDRLVADAQWYLTAEESAALWAAGCGAAGSRALAQAQGRGPSCEVAALFRILRGSLSTRRAAAVHGAFSRLGGAASGMVHLDTLAASYTAAQHPDVKANKRSAADVTSEFLDTFGVQQRTEARGGALGLASQRNVSAQDFEDYFADLSAALPDDAYFDLVVFGCWPAAREAGGMAGSGAQALLHGGGSKANPFITAPVGGAGTAGQAHGGGLNHRPSIFAHLGNGGGGAVPQHFNSLGSHALGKGRGASAPGGHGPLPGELLPAPARRTTEGGYRYVDAQSLSSVLSALRAHLHRCGPFAVSYLGAMLRRHDGDRDGLIDAFELRHALRDTIAGCGDVSPGPGAAAAAAALSARATGAVPAVGAGAEHPLAVSDADSDAVFTAAAQRFAPLSLDSPRPLVPLEAFHAALRGSPLNDVRRATVLSLFAQLDAAAQAQSQAQGGPGGGPTVRSGQGAIPIATVMLAFRAEGHPAVAAGRASVPALYRQFQDSFGEAFALSDRFGPSLRMQPGPAGEAYAGHGDGLVRLPFFQAWHEGLSCLIGGGGVGDDGDECVFALTSSSASDGSDNEFNLVAFSLWAAAPLRARGRSGNTAAANFDPRTMLAKGDEGEAGLISSMAKLGGVNRANQSNASSSAFAVGAGPGSRIGQAGLLQTQLQQQQAQQLAQQQQQQPQPHAQQSQYSSGLPLSPGRGGVAPPPVPLASVRGRAGASTGAGNFFASVIGVVNGGSGTNVGLQPRQAQGQQGGLAYPSSAAPALAPDFEAALRSARAVLLRRGLRGGFALVRAFEQAAGAVLGHGGGLASVDTLLPPRLFATVLSDAGLGLSPAQADSCVRGSSSGAGASPRVFVEALLGPLSPGREDVVRRAFDAVHRQAQQQQQLGGSSERGEPLLSVLQLLYASAQHPEVRAGKRAEEDALREFLETFSGPSFVSGHDRGDAAFVALTGFALYYTVASFFVREDASFAALLFATWALSAERHDEGLAAGAVAASSGVLSGGPRSPQPSRAGPAHHSVSEALGAGPASTRASHPRGPGQDHPHHSAYAGGWGVDNKRDFTARTPGWGIERL